MKYTGDQLQLSASDLVGHLNCEHLTALDMEVANGRLAKPVHWDPLLEILQERGLRHERAYLEHLRSLGHNPVTIDGVDISDVSVEQTLSAMRAGEAVIVQAALRSGRWSGRADILRRVERPSGLGAWSYEVIDTKLARETKGGTVLQLCLYSELLRMAQGAAPEYAHVVVPWTDFTPQSYRIADYSAFFRKARSSAEAATLGAELETYPEPNEHCDICRWRETCEKRLRDDDHLTFVAGISRNQITELVENGVSRLVQLAEMPSPMPWKPKRGAVQSFEKTKSQALIQLQSRTSGELLHELLPIEPRYGLCLLPEPSEGDIFFDLEGDPFVGEHGLEYLFGYQYRGADGTSAYTADWCFTREEEKTAFETFVDFVTARLETYPDLHIYHYAPYEPAALKRLMGRYASREGEIDNLLRGHRFVDLYSVVRGGIRASVESYSIKRLEAFYGYERRVPLTEANVALSALQAGLELDDTASISDAEKTAVEGYNQDDCASTQALRDWLELLRRQVVASGTPVPRPAPGGDAPSEELSERIQRVNELVARLSDGIPIDPRERSDEQQAQWILANILDWNRREEKAEYWEKFRLEALNADQLLDERAAVSGLVFLKDVPAEGRLPVHRYLFPQQDTDLRPDKKLRTVGGETFGEVAAISSRDRTIDIKKMGKTAGTHPDAVYTHEIVPGKEQADCLLRIGEFVAGRGLTGDGPYIAARDLVLRRPPSLGGAQTSIEGESTLDAALRLAGVFQKGVLPIQGPPGTGKSHTGARMICRFVQLGLKVGITANSHKVIRNLLDKVLEAAAEMKVDLNCIQKAKEKEDDQDRLAFAKSNEELLGALASGHCQVAGATGFLWSREDAFETVDVLVVDEAAQVSLANVLAVSHAAQRLILLGDPQQLDEPSQGTHPEGTGVSSLEHVLNGRQTIDPSAGLFLSETWRMCPAICGFDSELFYEDKLSAVDGCEQQRLLSDGIWQGAGLRYVSVPHVGNKSYSVEEAGVVMEIVMTILGSNARWVDRKGDERPVTIDDILVITPYNAQVFEIQQRLPPGARVGTVDKFQGQEAPVAIYSMATSSHADAPRGMEFLYSANRFNVAISRAKCLAILVASPHVFEAECKTPRQMQLANAFCRYLEVADAA
jgi:predicted RecB family nuclease